MFIVQLFDCGLFFLTADYFNSQFTAAENLWNYWIAAIENQDQDQLDNQEEQDYSYYLNFNTQDLYCWKRKDMVDYSKWFSKEFLADIEDEDDIRAQQEKEESSRLAQAAHEALVCGKPENLDGEEEEEEGFYEDEDECPTTNQDKCCEDCCCQTDCCQGNCCHENCIQYQNEDQEFYEDEDEDEEPAQDLEPAQDYPEPRPAQDLEPTQDPEPEPAPSLDGPML